MVAASSRGATGWRYTSRSRSARLWRAIWKSQASRAGSLVGPEVADAVQRGQEDLLSQLLRFILGVHPGCDIAVDGHDRPLVQGFERNLVIALRPLDQL